jgi:hypothetical protein
MRVASREDSHTDFGSPIEKVTYIVSLEKLESNGISGVDNSPFIFSDIIDNFDRMYDYMNVYGDVVTNLVGALLNNPNEHKKFNRRYKNWGSFKDKLRSEYGLATLVRYVTINFTVSIS